MCILKHIFDSEYFVNDFQKCLFIGLTVILKAFIWKRYGLSDRSQYNFDTDYHILQLIYFDDIVDNVEFHKYRKGAGLPIREKDDCFNAKELRERVKGLQAILACKVEEAQAVQGDSYWAVVNEGDVQIATG